VILIIAKRLIGGKRFEQMPTARASARRRKGENYLSGPVAHGMIEEGAIAGCKSNAGKSQVRGETSWSKGVSQDQMSFYVNIGYFGL